MRGAERTAVEQYVTCSEVRVSSTCRPHACTTVRQQWRAYLGIRLLAHLDQDIGVVAALLRQLRWIVLEGDDLRLIWQNAALCMMPTITMSRPVSVSHWSCLQCWSVLWHALSVHGVNTHRMRLASAVAHIQRTIWECLHPGQPNVNRPCL